MSNIKLVVADIDLTLTTSDRRFTDKTRDVINKLHEKGILFGIASGRPLDAIESRAKKWNLKYPLDLMIGLNGAELHDGITGKESTYFNLKREWMKEILEFMEPYADNAFKYYHGKLMFTHDDPVTMMHNNYEKEVILLDDPSKLYDEEAPILLFRMSEENVIKCEQEIAKQNFEEYQGFKTQTTLIEFSDKRISKGFGLQKFCEIHNLDLNEVATFGDTSNDNGMIEIAGMGVCMANGSDDTKAIANFITKYSSDEDGFARFVEEHIL